MAEKTKRVKKIVYCNPSVRGAKFSADLHKKCDIVTGETLRDTQMTFRAGYLQAQRDSAEAYKRSKKFYEGKDAKTIRQEKMNNKKKRSEKVKRLRAN